MTEPIVQQVAMKAVIVHDKKILLLRESAEHDTNTKAGKYQFPGGRIDPGEPFEQGLRREVMEETGMEIEIGQPIFAGEWFPVIKGIPYQIVGMFLICRSQTADVRISDEHDAFIWLAEEMIPMTEIMAPDDQVVKLYFTQYS